ncbi:lipid II flippase MurJ [Vibrio parahaemolyticus]|nr:lipid II flippase MurJ [Vibrio parahaemolyticus]
MKSAMLIILLIFIGKVSGLGKDVLTTAFFGVSLDTDAFFLSTYISSLLYIALYGSISLVIVPAYQSYRDGEIVKGNLNFAIVLLFLASMVLSVISYVFAAFIVDFFYSGESEHMLLMSSEYLKLMVITYPLSTCVGILNAISSVKSKPIYVYINPVFNNISFCVLVYAFSDGGSFEPILIGAIFTWLIILCVNFIGSGNFIVHILDLCKHVKPSSSLLFVSSVSIIFALAEQIINFSPIYISSFFGDGAISYYSLASKLTLLFLSLSLLIINTHFYPKFSKMDNIELVSDLIKQYLPLLLSFLLAIVSFSIVFSISIIKIVFERGEFNSGDANNVAMVFSIIVVTIPFVLLKDLSTRALFSQGKGFVCIKATAVFSLLIVMFSIFGLGYLGFLESLLVYVSLNIIFSLYVYFSLFNVSKAKEFSYLFMMIVRYFVISISLSLLVFYTVNNIYLSAFVYFVAYFFIMFLIKDNSFFKLCGMLYRRKNETTV